MTVKQPSCPLQDINTHTILEILDIQRYNSYLKLVRVRSYVNHFNNCRNTEKTRCLTQDGCSSVITYKAHAATDFPEKKTQNLL